MKIFYIGIDKEGFHWLVQVNKETFETLRWIDFVGGRAFPNSKDAKRFTHESALVQVTLESASRAKFDIRVDPDYEDKDVGTLLLTFIENYLMKEGIEELTGDISKVDQDHFGKLKHFYKKNHYVVEFFDDLSPEYLVRVGRVYKRLV